MKTHKIALYKSSWGSLRVFDEDYGGIGDSDIRVSEFVEIEFTPLAKEHVIQAELEMIDKAEEELSAKYQQAKQGLQQRRNDLLAITYDPTETNLDEIPF